MLGENRPLLESIAAALLERETLTREDFVVLMKGDKLPPRPPSAIPEVAPAVPPLAEPKRVSPPLLGGPEPSPA